MRSGPSDRVVSARRFFVEGTREVGGVVEIEGSDAHKITRVLRLQRGDRIEIVDSTAASFEASIGEAGSVVRADLLALVAEPVAPRETVRCDVAQAVPKGRRMDLVIEKGTELGANAFLPFYCERSVARDLGEEKLARWRRLARTAAAQSGRVDIPEIWEPMRFDALLERFTEYRRVLFAWELASRAPLYQRLLHALPPSGSALVVVGPEGGFTHSEAEAAEAHGAVSVSLGRRILRTDTAALALLAVIGSLAS
jgi:16S rRNA (uracil1498-N3)-methyltransferase